MLPFHCKQKMRVNQQENKVTVLVLVFYNPLN